MFFNLTWGKKTAWHKRWKITKVNVKQKKLRKDILNLYGRKKTKFSIKKYEKNWVNTWKKLRVDNVGTAGPCEHEITIRQKVFGLQQLYNTRRHLDRTFKCSSKRKKKKQSLKQYNKNQKKDRVLQTPLDLLRPFFVPDSVLFKHAHTFWVNIVPLPDSGCGPRCNLRM